MERKGLSSLAPSLSPIKGLGERGCVVLRVREKKLSDMSSLLSSSRLNFLLFRGGADPELSSFGVGFGFGSEAFFFGTGFFLFLVEDRCSRSPTTGSSTLTFSLKFVFSSSQDGQGPSF